ncbi:SCP2 domain-containing protein [Pectobacterium sp. B1J-3]|uniref:ubiquinone anaerobic biosynthesis accessory factor UbiT n=1 Tax=Pectobacterium sp. B1J-3 TaxID=3385371 RepID=UPI003906C7C1
MLEKLRAQIVRQGPGLLGKPLKFTPFALQRQVLEQMLHWQFRQALDDGDLAFLEGRWLKIEVRDVGLQWFMTLRDNRLIVSQQETPDVSFSADANDLILIAARKEDPDTLFFQRRLRIEGDTELGLYVKNLMDAIELETMPPALRIGLVQLANFVEAGLQEGVGQTADHAPVSC